MMYPRSEILFPHRCVRELKGLRGPLWDELVEHIATLPDTHKDSLSFALMMIKLSGCLDCDLDSYKASLGCCTCAKRTINAFKGSDKLLLKRFGEAQEEFTSYTASKQSEGEGEAA
ncbi:MAG: hypothetical protein JW934_07410 [Anaerolineae bacterium]|nr:hypothetical protein [Anaerolineae bacterium]